jgi:hypothetical protein
MRRKCRERGAATPRQGRTLTVFMIGHGISRLGTWTQAWAEALLVWELSHSVWAGSLVFVLHQIVMLGALPCGGWLADHARTRWPT